VQQIGRAGRDGNEAKSIVFYSIKKDLRTNFGILAENRETCVLYNNKKQVYIIKKIFFYLILINKRKLAQNYVILKL
jgi:superfamily II DNA helicase RecQ